MRINHNISSMVTQGALFLVGRDLGKSLERLSTGLRINRSSDDAAGLGVSENLRAQVRGLAQAQRNALDGIAAINIAEGAANEISAVIQRMRELAIQSASDTLTSTERGYLESEFTALSDEIDRIAGVTNYNGMQLIDDSGGDGRFGDLGDGDVLYIDAVDSGDAMLTVETLADLTAGTLGTDIMSISDQAAAQGAIGNLDTALDTVNSARGDMGALVNRLEHAINNLLVSESNQQAAESVIRDADFAKESTQFTRNQILTQSATAMLAQANVVQSSVLALLR
jgi:flagellin